MKWSWKAFGLQFVSAFLLALLAAFVVSKIIDARRGAGAETDSTLLSMTIGGFLAPMILAGISGWKFWSLKPLLVAAALVSICYSGNLAIGLATVFFTALVNFVFRKVRQLSFFYFPAKESPPETLS
jgi:asparagine N-glycosylation enzyme membrane subunit Stt3